MKLQSEEKKLANWESAFNSMNNSQSKDREILAGLIKELNLKIRVRKLNQFSEIEA